MPCPHHRGQTLCRKTTNRLRAIETHLWFLPSIGFEPGRKTTNRLRAIETHGARFGLPIPRFVARQLIAFGRLKHGGGNKMIGSRRRVARQLIAFGRLKRFCRPRPGRSGRGVARQLIAFGRLKLTLDRCNLLFFPEVARQLIAFGRLKRLEQWAPAGGYPGRKTTNRLRAIETRLDERDHRIDLGSQDN